MKLRCHPLQYMCSGIDNYFKVRSGPECRPSGATREAHMPTATGPGLADSNRRGSATQTTTSSLKSPIGTSTRVRRNRSGRVNAATRPGLTLLTDPPAGGRFGTVASWRIKLSAPSARVVVGAALRPAPNDNFVVSIRRVCVDNGRRDGLARRRRRGRVNPVAEATVSAHVHIKP